MKERRYSISGSQETDNSEDDNIEMVFRDWANIRKSSRWIDDQLKHEPETHFDVMFWGTWKMIKCPGWWPEIGSELCFLCDRPRE